jgi:hypothetical protein
MKWPLAGLVAGCCLLAAAYSVVVPPFEAPDEPGHYAYVQWLLAGRGVPLQGAEPPPLQPEFSQPPLYYLAVAPLAAIAGGQPANLPDWEAQHNPFQDATEFGNVNLFLHLPSEGFPWTGQVLGLHLMRLANALFVALMVLATYGCALELGLAKALAWCCAAAAGLVPQLLFLGGALNADNAIGSTSAAALYLLLRWLKRGPDVRLALLLGLALGAAALSKLSGLGAAAVALGFMLLRTVAAPTPSPAAAGEGTLSGRQSGDGRRSIEYLADLLAAGAMAACVAGWWYVRNWLALGDPLGWNAMLPATGAMLRDPPLSFGAAALDLLGRWYTGLAVFGWTNVRVPWVWYWLFLMLAGWAMVGTILALRKALAKRWFDLEHLLLVLWPLAFFVSLSRWVEVNTASDQWRLLFPAYPALAILGVTGLLRLLRGAWQILLAVPSALLALNVAAIAATLVPVYAGPRVYAGPIEHPLEVKFGDALELAGYSTPAPAGARLGDTVTFDLYWRALAPIPKNYAADLAAVDAGAHITWKEQSVPDEGRAPMPAWPTGQLIRDRHRLEARGAMAGAQTLLLSVIDPVPPGEHLPASTASGTRLRNDTATLGRFVVLTAKPVAAVNDAVAFQDHLQLAGHSFDQSDGQLRVTLDWKASAPASKDYTVFVHMVAPNGQLVAQHDSQPAGGAFPTSLLAAGSEVPDPHVLDVSRLPAGTYQLEIGLYDLASGARLPTEKGDSSYALPVTLKESRP